MSDADAAIVILAGGMARRLPRKLERSIDGVPMIVRVFERLQGRWPITISARSSFPDEIDARLNCPVVVDRWPGRGPLAGLLSAAGSRSEARIFAVAGDLPFIDIAALERLEAAWQPGDEAVIYRHGERIEPLAALYDRAALLREGFALLRGGEGAMHALIERLTSRFLASEPSPFANVNTPDDLARLTLISKGSP